MILTKQYRIFWNADKVIQNNYKEIQTGVTYCGNSNYEYREADTLEEIEQIVIDNNLIENTSI